MPKKKSIGTVYILHFDQKLSHSQHYIGWTKNLAKRVNCHKIQSSHLKYLCAHIKAGHKIVAVSYCEGTRDDERKLKRRKKAKQLCEYCRLKI